jgi:hypothetical protein
VYIFSAGRWNWELNQVFTFAKQVVYCLEHISSPLFLWLFWKWGLENYLPRLASNSKMYTFLLIFIFHYNNYASKKSNLEKCLAIENCPEKA